MKKKTYSSTRKIFGPPLKKCLFSPLNFVLVLIFSSNLLLLLKNKTESISAKCINWKFKKYAQIVTSYTFCQFDKRANKDFFLRWSCIVFSLKLYLPGIN